MQTHLWFAHVFILLFTILPNTKNSHFLPNYFTLCRTMFKCSEYKMTSRAVVSASDEQLVKAHTEFCKWKKKNPVSGTLCATDFTFALKHYAKHHTKNIPSFKSSKTYARAMVTTYIIGKKAYWKAREDAGWKRADLKPPPVPRNGAPVRVFYNKNRIYKFVTLDCAFVLHCLCTCHTCAHTQEVVRCLLLSRLCFRWSTIHW